MGIRRNNKEYYTLKALHKAEIEANLKPIEIESWEIPQKKCKNVWIG